MTALPLLGASEIDIASSLMYNWVIYGGSLEGMLALFNLYHCFLQFYVNGV